MMPPSLPPFWHVATLLPFILLLLGLHNWIKVINDQYLTGLVSLTECFHLSTPIPAFASSIRVWFTLTTNFATRTVYSIMGRVECSSLENIRNKLQVIDTRLDIILSIKLVELSISILISPYTKRVFKWLHRYIMSPLFTMMLSVMACATYNVVIAATEPKSNIIISSRVKALFTRLVDDTDTDILLQNLSPLNNESEIDTLIQSFSLNIEDHDDNIVTLVQSFSSSKIADHPTLIPVNTASETFPSMSGAAELEDTNSRNDSEDTDYDSEETNQKPIVTIFTLKMLQKTIQSIFPDNIELGPEYEMNGIDSLGYKILNHLIYQYEHVQEATAEQAIGLSLAYCDVCCEKDGMWFFLCFMNSDVIRVWRILTNGRDGVVLLAHAVNYIDQIIPEASACINDDDDEGDLATFGHIQSTFTTSNDDTLSSGFNSMLTLVEGNNLFDDIGTTTQNGRLKSAKPSASDDGPISNGSWASVRVRRSRGRR